MAARDPSRSTDQAKKGLLVVYREFKILIQVVGFSLSFSVGGRKTF